MKNNKKKRIVLALSITTIFTLVLILIMFIFLNSILNDNRTIIANSNLTNDLEKKSNFLEQSFKPTKDKFNFIILGLDDNLTRVDGIMVGMFETKTKSIKIVSVPRDLYVTLDDSELDFLETNGKYMPKSNYCKLSEVHHYAGPSYGVDFTVNKLENILNIKINYYVRIDLEGFRYLVDEIGGVNFDVPQRMYYEDPLQNLYIDLQKGEQVLDGKQAEGLIRYRKPLEGYEKESPAYLMGDLQRVKVQQAFIKQFLLKLTSENQINNSLALLSTIDKYVTTNFNISDVAKYIKYLQGFSPNNIKTYSIPTIEKKVTGESNDYIAINEDKTKALVDEVFYNIKPKPISSKNKKIQILNGGQIQGLATSKKKILDSDGFFVENCDDKEDNSIKNTVIYVKEDGMGNDLVTYFTNSTIVIDNTIEHFDIVILLGKNEK